MFDDQAPAGLDHQTVKENACILHIFSVHRNHAGRYGL